MPDHSPTLINPHPDGAAGPERRERLRRKSDRLAAAGAVALGDLVSIELIVESSRSDSEKLAAIREVLALGLVCEREGVTV